MADPITWIGSAELRERFGVGAAISALEGFLSSETAVEAPQRTVTPLGEGELLAMPAASERMAGIKLVTIHPHNPGRGLPLIHSVYVLMDATTLAPFAILDGTELTRLRTSAVSALATRYLAAEDAGELLIFGAGVQAEAHVQAMRAVRPIRGVTIVGRSDSADRLVARLQAEGELAAKRGVAEDVTRANIVCTCTTASEPLFAGEALSPGTHVNAVGTYQPHTREIDSRTVTSAGLFVDDLQAALAEAGELRIPIDAGELDTSAIAGDLRALVRGRSGRRSVSEVTLFKSVGVAWEDLAVATAACEQMGAQG